MKLGNYHIRFCLRFPAFIHLGNDMWQLNLGIISITWKEKAAIRKSE